GARAGRSRARRIRLVLRRLMAAVKPSPSSVDAPPAFGRVLLKVSGEALMGPREFGLDAPTVDAVARELVGVRALGIEIAVVIGGGNLYRGMQSTAAGMNRATGD